jgi:hypothetical protein
MSVGLLFSSVGGYQWDSYIDCAILLAETGAIIGGS